MGMFRHFPVRTIRIPECENEEYEDEVLQSKLESYHFKDLINVCYIGEEFVSGEKKGEAVQKVRKYKAIWQD